MNGLKVKQTYTQKFSVNLVLRSYHQLNASLLCH